MCMVSLVMDQFQPFRPSVYPDFWTLQRFDELQEILRRLDRLDAAMGLKDCGREKKEALLKELADELGYEIKPTFDENS